MAKYFTRLSEEYWKYWSDETKYRYTIEKNGGEEVYDRLRFFQQNISRAANRKNPHAITIDKWNLEEIYQNQNGKCILSGSELEFERGGTNWGGKWCNPKSCTIDRIDNTKGYIIGNVQLVTWEVNSVKTHLTNNAFIQLCESITKYQEMK